MDNDTNATSLTKVLSDAKVDVTLAGSATIDDLFDAKRRCLQNQSLVNIATSLGLLGQNTSDFNVTLKIQEIIDSQDLAKLIEDQDFRYLPSI